jgi:hypothetical protein
MWFQRIVELLEEIRDRLPPPLPAEEQTTAVCRHCMEVFTVGPGTGRRMDAIFCSDAHRVRFHSLQRSPKPNLSTDNRQ